MLNATSHSSIVDINKLESSATTFFAELDPALISATFVALAGLFGVLIGVFLVNRGHNRKGIILTSAIGTAVAFATLAFYFMYSMDNGGSNGNILAISFV
jgi:hypothetical protein